MEHTFNLRQISAFKVTLDYKAARATQRNHISKKRKNNERKKERKEGRKEGMKEGRKEERKVGRKVFSKKKKLVRAVVADAFNPSIWEAEADRLKCSRPAWSTQ